jgi:hypothetical protein
MFCFRSYALLNSRRIEVSIWKVPGKDLGFSAAARVPRLCSLLIQKVADADVRREKKAEVNLLPFAT